MKTNIKYMWLINLGVVAVIGIYFGLIRNGLLVEQVSALFNWFSWKETWNWIASKQGLTVLCWIVIIPIDLLIATLVIEPYVKALFEETTNRNVNYSKKFKELEDKISGSKVVDKDVKQLLLNILQNHNKSIYKDSSRLLLTEFQGSYGKKCTQNDVDVFLKFLGNNFDRFKSVREMLNVTDSEMTAYTVYLKLNKPESMKRMKVIDNNNNQLNNELNSLFEDKVDLDTKKLLETVGV